MNWNFIQYYLLRRNIKVLNSQIYFFKNIHTRNDEEYARTTSSTGEETPKAKDNCSLIFLMKAMIIRERMMKFVT